MKKIGMLLMTFVVMLFMAVTCVNATEEQELGKISHVELSPEGVLTFDAVEGATSYDYALNKQYISIESGGSIVDRLHTLCDVEYMQGYCPADYSGNYVFNLQAYNGDTKVAVYYGFVHFNGTAFTLEESNVDHYVLIFNSNGGSGVDPMYPDATKPIERPEHAPTKEGTTFLGWYTEAEFEHKYTFETVDRGYQVLYAKWGEPTLIEAVTFDGLIIPVEGTHPEEEVFRTITTSTKGLRIINAEWRDESNEGKPMTTSDTFVADKHYILSIAIDFEDGYAFPERDPFWIEDHMTLNIEPNMKDFRADDANEFLIFVSAVKAESTEPVVVAPVLNLDGFTLKAGTNNVKATWNKVDEAKGYYVYAGTNKKKLTKIATINKNSTVSYNKKKLKANTTYYYQVVAYNVVNKKNKTLVKSAVKSIKTAPVTPKVSIAAKNGESLKLTVSAAKGATKYEIYRSTKKDGEYFIEGELTKAGKFTNKGLDLNKTYYYKVRACNKSSCSGFSKVVSKKVTMSTPTVKAKSTAKKQVTLTFGGDSASEVGYLYRSTKKNGKYTLVATLNEASFVDTTKSKKTYYYKIRTAANVDGKLVYSPYSKVVSVKSK